MKKDRILINKSNYKIAALALIYKTAKSIGFKLFLRELKATKLKVIKTIGIPFE